MGADNRRDPAVKGMRESHFLRSRLGVDVDEGRLDIQAQFMARQQVLDGAERIIQRVHEQPSHYLGDEDFAAIPQRDHGSAGARRAGRKIQRADQPRLAHNIGNDFLAIPGVVAERNGVRAGGEQSFRHFRRQAKAMRGIFRIHRHEIGPALGAQARQGSDDSVPAGAADKIA